MKILEQRVPLKSKVTNAQRKAWLSDPRARFRPVHERGLERAKGMVVAAAQEFFIAREKGDVCDCLTPQYSVLHDALSALAAVHRGEDIFEDDEHEG